MQDYGSGRGVFIRLLRQWFLFPQFAECTAGTDFIPPLEMTGRNRRDNTDRDKFYAEAAWLPVRKGDIMKRGFLKRVIITAAVIIGCFTANASMAAGAQIQAVPAQQNVQSDQTVSADWKYAELFDARSYYNNYPDLQKAIGPDAGALYRHFASFGVHEARVASPVFDVKLYREKYPDLQKAFGADWKAYYDHYLAYGKAEGRRAEMTTVLNAVNYASVFNASYYLNRYPDLKATFGSDEIAALRHFVNYGMREGRQASADFSVQVYMARYADLANAFGNNLPEYYYHYISLGESEHRAAR